MNNQTYNRIYNGIYNIVVDSLRQAAKEYHQKILGNVVQNIYNSPVSPYYDRTEGFLKSVSQGFNLKIDANGNFEIQLVDDKFIKASNGKKRKFGHHKSFPWDEPYPSNEEVRENLFEWLDEGFTILGKKHHSGYYFDVAEEEFWNRFKELFEGKLTRFLQEIAKKGG